VGFNTPFIPENIGASLYNFGFYKIQRHTKAIIVEFLTNFFSNNVKTYSLTLPEIVDLQNSSDYTKIFVSPDFPYTERKFPIIIVSVRDIKEKKMYIGADNVIGYKVYGTSSGRESVEIYAGAAEVSLNLTIITLSSEDRMKFSELVNICFSHYYRWQYIYTLDDGSVFNIVPNSTTISFSGEEEIADPSKVNMIYAINMVMTSFVEYTFPGMEQTGTINEVIIDSSSGIIPFSGS